MGEGLPAELANILGFTAELADLGSKSQRDGECERVLELARETERLFHSFRRPIREAKQPRDPAVGATGANPWIVRRVYIRQSVMRLLLVQIDTGRRMGERHFELATRPTRGPGGMVGLKKQIAVTLSFHHGQELIGEFGRALEIPAHVTEEPQAEPSGEEFPRHVYLAAKRSRALVSFRNLRYRTAGDERKAQGILKPDLLTDPPRRVGYLTDDLQPAPEIGGGLDVRRASGGRAAGGQPLRHGLLELLRFGKMMARTSGAVPGKSCVNTSAILECSCCRRDLSSDWRAASWTSACLKL
jgi:hypothetical protein